jgi:pyruvate dehydrogenase E1 component alpha subunit/2-oxoisovalerate dehydrogenase E1 component alpha subunit
MTSLSREQMLGMYRSMCLTRALEERLERLFKQGHIVGGLYRSLGQEATAVGSACALGPEDWLAPSIRDMGALLVRGVEPVDLFRQYTARRDAPTGGKDNTNHFTLPELGILGPVSPLGTQLAVLNGIALSFRMRGESRVCMTYQGEGATRTGTSHEGLNFAAVQRLPMVVVLEHNRWAYSTRSDREAAVESWTDVAGAYGLPVRGVDGNDVLEVYDAASEAVERARRGEGASLIVAETYRMLGHAQHDPQPYVDPAELEAWRERDPIQRFGRYVIENGLATEESLASTREAVEVEAAEAADEALAGPRPDPGEARTRAYAAEPADGGVPWTRRRVVGYPDAPSGVAPARPFDADDGGDGGGTRPAANGAASPDGKESGRGA